MKPGSGFSVRAAEVPMNDPYQTYTQASDNDAVWQALMTEAGRTSIGAQMSVPIRKELDY